MRSLKFKIVITFMLAGFGYFLLFSLLNFIVPIYNNPSLLLSSTALWGLIIFLLIVSFWIYAMVRIIQSLYNHLKHGTVEEQMMKLIKKERKSLDVFIDVAEEEFMKRKISRETYDEIQRLAGKKMIQLEAKKKEIEEPKKKKSQDKGN